MSANTEREIRLTEIPTELRNLRAEIDRHAGNWARELTRAEGLERQLKAAIEARDAARRTVEDLTAHSGSQGDYIARLQVENVQLRLRVEKLAEYVEFDMEHKGETVADDHIRDLILSAGIQCNECEGKGWEVDEEMVAFGGQSNSYRTRTISVDCERCGGIGQVLR
jgi:hypothetical protein